MAFYLYLGVFQTFQVGGFLLLSFVPFGVLEKGVPHFEIHPCNLGEQYTVQNQDLDHHRTNLAGFATTGFSLKM